MSVLYVTVPGACVHQEQGRLRVTKGKELLTEARLFDLERVVLLSGTAGLTSTAATALMEAGIECAFVSSSGKFRGFLSPARGRGAGLRLAQFAAYSDPSRRLELARAVVARKIRNSDVVLARRSRNDEGFHPEAERLRLKRAWEAAEECPGLDLLLGVEGEAARSYFAAFGRMLGGGFRFTERSRRPPRDPANALLSFGYTLLSSEAVAAVAGAGLDPAIGMLHALDDGRPSLALDLMEPFRTAVVDRLVLSLANRRMLSPLADFTEDAERGPRMSDEARKKFLIAYEARMTESFQLPRLATQITLREALRLEARHLAVALRDGAPFEPFVLR